MAWSEIRTLLPLEEFARIMAIPGWHFNQLIHPARPARACEDPWFQSGYFSDPNRIMGRDEVAQAIAQAEEMMANYAGFFMAPKWVAEEPHSWPLPKRGISYAIPKMSTDWGYLISAGAEQYELIQADVALVYSDPDNDGISELVTITFNTTESLCELAVIPPGRDPNERDWRIRSLRGSITAGVCVITGYTWQFVDPDFHLTITEGDLSDAAILLATVDIYRHYNRTDQIQAQYKWLGSDQDCGEVPVCDETCQGACVSILDSRRGIFRATTSTYDAATDSWTSANWSVTTKYPNEVSIWYYSGYKDRTAYGCETMSRALKEAIVALACTFLPESPCGCGLTVEKFEWWTEDMPMNTFDVALAQTHFGSTKRGAVLARNVVSGLQPIGRGG